MDSDDNPFTDDMGKPMASMEAETTTGSISTMWTEAPERGEGELRSGISMLCTPKTFAGITPPSMLPCYVRPRTKPSMIWLISSFALEVLCS
jgi:hypothetical protein